MAPPINVQDWYGDRHTCQIASGALARQSDLRSLNLRRESTKSRILPVTRLLLWRVYIYELVLTYIVSSRVGDGSVGHGSVGADP